MSTGCRHLEGALDALLSLDVGKVQFKLGLLAVELLPRIDLGGHQVLPSVEEVHHLVQVLHAVDLEFVDHCRLAGVLPGHDDALITQLTRLDGDGEGSLDGLQAAVETQLAHNQEVWEAFFPDETYRRQDTQRHGEVVCRPFLTDVGGCHVDDYLMGGKMITVDLEGGHDAFVAFLHRRVRQAHQEEPDAAGAVHLDGHRDGIDALDSRREEFH